MRHGITLFRSPASDLANLLLLASVSKSLAVSGTRALDAAPISLSESLVLQILRRHHLDPSQKLDFFRWASLRPNYKHSSSTYSQMFYTVCRAGCLNEIGPLLNLMKKDEIVVDSPTFKLLLDTVIRSGKFDSALEILDTMEELGTSLNPRMYNSILIAFIKKNQITLALSIFYKLLEVSEIDCLACNELLVALRKSEMKEDFRKVFQKLRDKDVSFDTWGYNICIHAFGCWRDLGYSLRLYKEMREKGCSTSICPDLCTYNSLLQVLFLNGNVKDALIVWEELSNSGHEADEFTYRILIQGCCKSFRIEDATRAFKEMQQNGFRPHTVVYNSLLDGTFKGRKLAEACQLFEKMIQEGVRASCWTYNILIDGLIKNGRGAAAYALFCDLKKKGQLVDGVTYSIVVLHLCREGQLHVAVELINEMEERGFTVDLVTITSLLVALHRHGRWDWAEQVMKHVRDSSLVPNVLRWRAEMEGLMGVPQDKGKDYKPLFDFKGDLTEVLRFVSLSDDLAGGTESTSVSDSPEENISFDGWSLSPYVDQLADKIQYGSSSRFFSLRKGQRVQGMGVESFDIDMVNTYMAIFLSKGKLSVACKLFEIFTSMGKEPVSYTYNSLMSSFIKKGYFNEAWGALCEMGEKLCPTDIATYNMIIQGLGKMGRADLASAVLDQLIKRGGYLDIVMYNTLIHVLGKAGRFDEANKLFKQMTSSGVNPDVVTFNILIEVHTKGGRVKEAYKFLRMMLDAGCSPNHITDTTLDLLERELEKLRLQKTSFVHDEEDK
ncbi:pentatricopeptide repeat-containing protein At4g01570 [Aristolochia californica]|uniref:pentatricopeptide repeat-containing protein At4g01570 n=1 Tax=Aristolochia californica TaxID=171875 RepID=UPI0035D83B43